MDPYLYKVPLPFMRKLGIQRKKSHNYLFSNPIIHNVQYLYNEGCSFVSKCYSLVERVHVLLGLSISCSPLQQQSLCAYIHEYSSEN